MQLIANKQLYNKAEYGQVTEGSVFECSEATGDELVRMGSARKVEPPRVQYDTKMITPSHAPQVSARPAFQSDVSVSYEEPETLAGSRPGLLPESGLPTSQPADSRGRGVRSRPDSKR